MSDKKISELTTKSPVGSGDFVAIVDISATAGYTTKKATHADFKGDYWGNWTYGNYWHYGSTGTYGSNRSNWSILDHYRFGLLAQQEKQELLVLQVLHLLLLDRLDQRVTRAH